MGVVYRARHTYIDQPVAIKVLHPHLAQDPTSARRFTREAKHTFRFDHPNCVRVSDFGMDATGLLYIAMEYLNGRTVGDELHVDGPYAAHRVARIGRQTADALCHAHALSIIHRDLKPDNLMLLTRGQDTDFVKVLDFGLAKLFVEETGATMYSISPLTQEGIVFGTPEYMSPEQASGQDLDGRSDLYSLGAVLYEMLTGTPPFRGDTFMAILTQHVKASPIAPRARRPDLDIPTPLEQVVLACLEKSPKNRPTSARALADHLGNLIDRLTPTPTSVADETASSPTVDLIPAQRAPDPETSINTATSWAPTPTHYIALSRSQRRRRWLIALTLGALVAAAIASALLLGGHQAPPSTTRAAPSPPQPVDATPVALDAPRTTDSGSVAVATQMPDAGTKQPRIDRRTQRKRTLQRHLRLVAHYERAGNQLKLIQELNNAAKLGHVGSTLKLAQLYGSKYRDMARACRLLKRLLRHRKARELYKQYACK